MVSFKELYIDLKVPKSGDIRTTLTTLSYYSDIVNEWVVVPTGLETDLGSIPRFLQGVFPKDGKAMFAYILHDHLYKLGVYSRSTSDDILREAMNALGVRWYIQVCVRFGLRIGGWYAWNKHREKEEE